MIFLAALLGACGGGASSSTGGSGGTGGGPGGGGGGNSFTPRPFPGDIFMRLPNQDGGAQVPHLAYNSALKEIFVCNPDINAVDAYSTVDGHWVGEFGVPGPSGLSFSPDNTTLAIGTITPYVYFADPTALHITSRVAIPSSLLTTDQGGDSLMPVMPYAMADGSVFILMGVNSQSSSTPVTTVAHLIRYAPSSGTFTSQDPSPGGLATIIPARSLDGKMLLVPGASSQGLELSVYSTDAQAYVATSAAFPNLGFYLAANPNGSQFATVQQYPGPGVVTFWGPNLQMLGQYTTAASSPIGAALYSRDGNFLYMVTDAGALVAFNTQTFTPSGYIGLAIGGLIAPNPQFFDADESYHLFAVAEPGGALILNASQTQPSLPTSTADFTTAAGEANPNVGPLAGGTSIQFSPAPAGPGSSDGIAGSMEAYFGLTPAPQDTVTPDTSSSNGQNSLTAVTPPASTPGPVSVVLTDAANDTVFLPDAYTYGPKLLRVVPNLAGSAGGDEVTIFAYGLGFFDLSELQVTIGGAAADLSTAVLNSYSSDYPEDSVTVHVPPGTPGWADVVISTSNGSDTLKRGVQYLQAEANVPGGPFTFALYDSVRSHFYLTGNANTVAVFDPATQAFLAPLQSSAVTPSAILQGGSLTPDSSKLLVADPTDGLVIIFDLVGGTSTGVNVMLPSDPKTTVFGTPQPAFVSTAANNRAFVSIVPCVANLVREINLTTLAVSIRTDASPASCPDYVPFPANGTSSSDGSTIVYAGNSGNEPPGAEYVWRYSAASDTFTGPVITQDNPWVGAQSAVVNADGSVIGVSSGTVDQQLRPLAPYSGTFGPYAWALNDTGSLAFCSYDSILISDTHNGRALLTFTLSNGMSSIRPLAIDPSGKHILVALFSGGVSYLELGVVPLSIGTVSPAQASTGTMLTIRGSGFVPGTAVTIGGKQAACASSDSETLSCAVPSVSAGAAPMSLTNPDGQTYSFENAFTVQ